MPGSTCWPPTPSAVPSTNTPSPTRSNHPTWPGSSSSIPDPKTSTKTGNRSPPTPSEASGPRPPANHETKRSSSWSASCQPEARTSGCDGPPIPFAATAADANPSTITSSENSPCSTKSSNWSPTQDYSSWHTPPNQEPPPTNHWPSYRVGRRRQHPTWKTRPTILAEPAA